MYHPPIAQGKWNSLSTVEQMAHIGSEVSRATRAKKESLQRMKLAVYRALELIDLSVRDPKNTNGLKEILRVRECIADSFLGDNTYQFSDEWWEKYFLEFAIAARKHT